MHGEYIESPFTVIAPIVAMLVVKCVQFLTPEQMHGKKR